MSDVVRFTNGYLALPDGHAVRADLYISQSQGIIISGQSIFFDATNPPHPTIDLKGNLLSPGLIDIQINGAYGVDFSELNVDAGKKGEAAYVRDLELVMARIVETGCTSFLPTIITQREELYAKLTSLLQPRSVEGCAHVLGYHAEGPFLHPLRKGAHSETLLMVASDDPPIETLERVYGKAGLDQDGVKLITLAPDVEGVMGCIPELTQRGVTVSIGHSDADLDQATEAVEKGARMITHLFKYALFVSAAQQEFLADFSAMPPIHHREPGVIGLLGSEDEKRPYFGIIVDGQHSHPNTVRIAYRAATDRCILVTDAHSIMDPNLPDGLHDWRPGTKFRKEGPTVYIDGTNTLAGSCAPLPLCLRNLCKFTGATLPKALLTATLQPALLLGGTVARRKGQLKEGFDADLCILDWKGNVLSTWIMGKEAWRDMRWGKAGLARGLGEKELVNGHAA